VIAARGHEAYWANRPPDKRSRAGWSRLAPAAADGGNRPRAARRRRAIRISSNENPLGPARPCSTHCRQVPEASRYPFNSTPSDTKLAETIAALYKAKPENVVLGAARRKS
jgi:histidinol-phosphate/aromatic aminotransferase/cobyric acid decarboxylase-like protein